MAKTSNTPELFDIYTESHENAIMVMGSDAHTIAVRCLSSGRDFGIPRDKWDALTMKRLCNAAPAPKLVEALRTADAALRHHRGGDSRSDEDIELARAALADAGVREEGR
jgi:hypothetical protein